MKLVRGAAALAMLAAWLWAAATARADLVSQQGEAVNLVARAGFDGYYKDGLWVPIRVTLANNGPDVEGTLSIASPRYHGGEIFFTRTISLPTQSRKEVFLYIAPEGYVSGVKVAFASGRDMLATATTRLTQAGSGDLVYGVMASSPSAFNVLSQIDPIGGQAFVAELGPEDLPPIAQAWDSLDVLVISDLDTGVLTPEQRQAMAGWLSSGGRLIVAGGPGWQKTIAGLGPLLPLNLTGTRTLDSLAALSAYTHNSSTLDGPAVVVTGEPVGGGSVALASADGVPLIVTRRVGFGEVDLLTFDPALAPLARWPGAEGLYRNLLSSAEARPSWANGFRNWYSASEALNAIPGIELPNALQLCGFLAVYVLMVGPGNFLILHRLKRRELAWFTIPAIIVVFTGIAYLAGFQLRGTQAMLHRLAVVQVWPNSERAQVDMLIGLFSPRRTEYDLEIGGDSLTRPLPADGYAGGGGVPGGLALEQNGVTRIVDLRADIGDLKSFVAQGHIAAPRFASELTLSVRGNSAALSGEVTNHSDLTLADAVVLAPGGVQRLGQLNPGQRAQINLSLVSGRAIPATLGNQAVILPAGAVNVGGALYSPYPSASGYDTTIDDILGSSYYYDDRKLYRKYSLLSAMIDQYSGVGRGSGVYLVGWSDAAPLPAEITDHSFGTADATAYLVELRPEVVVGQGRLVIPPGLMTWSVIDPGQQGSVTPYDAYVYQGYFAIRFAPSQLLDFRRVESLTMNLSSYGSTGASGLNIDLWDFEAGDWVAQANPTWGKTTIADPERFVGPQGEIQVRVTNSSTLGSVSVEAIDFTLVVER